MEIFFGGLKFWIEQPKKLWKEFEEYEKTIRT